MTNESVNHTCRAPMFSGIIPGCPGCEAIANDFGFEPYAWHTIRQAQSEINHTSDKEHEDA